jgi:hypothetical protein
MPVETAADRAAFVSIADFGVAASYTHGATTATVAGIFDATAALVADGDGLGGDFAGPGVLTSRPALTVTAASLPAGAGEGDAVTVEGVDYQVAEFRPDGTGMVVLILEKA